MRSLGKYKVQQVTVVDSMHKGTGDSIFVKIQRRIITYKDLLAMD